MADELSDADVFGQQPKELSDQDVFGQQQSVIASPSQLMGQPVRELAANPPTPEDTGQSQFEQAHPTLTGIADVVESIPQMVESIPGMAYQGLKFAAGGPQERGQVLSEALGQAIPQGQQMARDIQSPIGSREFARGAANVGLMALPALGELGLHDVLFGERSIPRPPIQTGIHDIIFPTEEAAPLTQATEAAVTPEFQRQLEGPRNFQLVPEPPPEISPARPIEETIRYQPTTRPGEQPPLAPEAFPSISRSAEEARRTARTQTAQDLQTEGAQRAPSVEQAQSQTVRNVGEQPNAIEKPSPESVPVPALRESVGKEAPLRQQGETTGARETEARQGTEAGQEVAPEKPPVQSSNGEEPHVSTLANRFTQERTAQGELGEIAPGQGYSTNELAQRGLRMSPEEVNQHVSDLMQGTGDPIRQAEAVRAEEARLSRRSNELSRVAEANPNDLNAKIAADNAFKDVTDFHNGPVARLKTIFHGTGMGLQGELPIDLSTFNGMREAWLRDTGELPSPKIEPELRRAANGVAKSIGEENGAREKLSNQIADVTSRTKLPTPEEVRNNIADRMKVEPCRT